MSDSPIIITTPPQAASFFQRRYAPIATFVLLALNVAIFALMEYAGGSQNPEVLLNFGASYGPFIHRGEYWRLVMPMFLHIGWAHLIINSIGLFALGRILESVYGYGRFTVLYVASGIGSSLLSMTLSHSVSAGASGAIFGMAGAMLTVGYLHRETVPRRWRRAFGGGILPLIILNLALGFSIPGIDNWGHLGGLFVGMLMSGLIPPPRLDWNPGPTDSEPSQLMAAIPLAVVVLAMGAAVEHYRAFRPVARLIEESRKLRAAGQADKALEPAKAAVQLLPHDERPHEELAALYFQQGHVDDAIREFNEARRLNPLSLAAQRGLARAYHQKGDEDRVAKIFEEMLGDDAKGPEIQRALGDLYLQEEFYAEAIQHYDKALQQAPNDAATHNNLAWLLATANDQQFRNPQAALEHAQKAVAVSEWKEATFIDTLAEALYVNGKYDEAVKTQTLALKKDPDNREYQEHMARYRKAAGA